MLINYLKIAWRNIWKSKVFSLINIIGLSIGLSAAFVIGAIIYYDMTFDKFHTNGNYIYRVTTEFNAPEGNFYNSGVSVPLARALEGTSGIEHISTMYTISPYQVENPSTDKIFQKLDNVIYTDSNYFQIFDYQWLAGDSKTALSSPAGVVLTENRLRRYFPDLKPSEVIGKTLVYNDTLPINVTGIVKNLEGRSDLVFEEFISFKTIGYEGLENRMGGLGWDSTNSGSQLFVKLNREVDLGSIQMRLDALAKEHQDKETLAFGQQRNFHLQPLSDIHFNPDYGTYDYSRAQASKPILISLALIALFLLLLGCINFINLNTAQATKRAKEIGIRKTLGSSRKQLIFQFMGETFLLTMGAATLSLVFSSGLFKVFSDFMPQGIDFDLLKSPILIISIVFLLGVVVLFSGFYPALVLSHFKPVSVLQNKVVSGSDKLSMRKYLTTFQFVIAQVFIIATVLVGKQIHFLMNEEMGFKTDGIAYIRTPYNDRSMDKRLRFINELKAVPQIQEVTLGGNPPASRSTYSSGVIYRDDEKEVHSSLQLLYGHSDYLELYNLRLVAGRMPLNDTIREYVINKTFMGQLGFKEPQEALGRMLTLGEEKYPIVGIMNDFYQRSLRTPIKPMALVGDWYRDEYSQFNTVHILLGSGSTLEWGSTMAKLKETWNLIYSGYDFDPKFVDDTIRRFYEQEHRTSVLLKWATGLAILISCLGLLGLVIHTTERRTKEIGIRKVLGASLAQLNVLLCKDFLVLVGVAFAIAIPLSWWGLHSWLQEFAYKTELSWWVFLLSGIAMLLIALIIMSIQTIAAANANPVESLRTE